MSGATQQSATAPQASAAPEVRIDRLILEIPGLDPRHARALAHGIAEGLASSGASAAHKAGATPQVTASKVSVSLAEPNGPPADLAARIVAALMARLV